MKQFLFLIIFSTFLILQGRAQSNFTLRGKIIEKNSGEALPFANIQVKGTSIGTSSNADGFFTLFDVPSGEITIQVRYVGFQDKEVTVNERDDLLVIALESSYQQLQEVIVEGTGTYRQMINASENISQVRLSPQALQSLPSIGEQDIFRTLQLLPGISGTNEASSGLYVRGGTPDQNLVLLDGFTVYHVDHFYGFFSAFNPNAIKDVQLYKGGFEAKFGGRLSSVVELTGKTGNQKKLAAGGGIGAISANAYLEIPLGERLNFFVAGRRSYTDIIESGIYNDIFDLYNDQSNATIPTSNVPQRNRGNRNLQQQSTEPSFYFYDLNSKLTFRPGNKDIISFSFYNGKDDLDNSRVSENSFERRNQETINLRSDVSDLLQWGNMGSSLRWARQWNSKFYSNLVASYSNYFSDRDLLTITDIVREDTTISRTRGTLENNDLQDYTIVLNNEYQFNSSHTLSFGVQSVYNKIRYNFSLNDTINLIDRNNEGVLTSVYIQDQWQLFRQFSVTGGIRASYFDVTKKEYFEPRLSAFLKVTDRLQLKAAWGHYYQFVNRIVREDVTQGSRDFWLLADDQASPVSFSRHLIGGLSYETDDWLIDAEVFDKSLDGISEFSLRFRGARPNQEGEDQFFFQGTGVARGLEFLLQRKRGALKGWLSYTLSEVVHDIPGISDNPFYALHDSRHEINLVTTYEWRKWVLGATWIYGTGRPYTAPYGVYEITTLDGTAYEYISVGAKNAFRLPDYHRLDLSVNYNFKIGSGNASLGLSLFNLYNRQNVWYKEFLIEEEEVIETNVNLIGFTPNLFFSLKF